MSSSMVPGRLILRPIVREELVLPPTRRKPFLKQFTKRIKKMEEKVQDYLIDPSEENIHDVRTSIRRLDASHRLLPKKIRKQPKMSGLRGCYKGFFRINSNIRDMDIIRSKFTKYPQNVTSRYPDFLNSLQEHREAKLKEAKRMALDVYNLKPSGIKLAKVPRKKLQKRYEKVTANFVDEIEDLFPIVVADSSKQAELHQMRKDCKKLRYTLEIEESTAKAATKELKGTIGLLEEMQEILGAIHDCDIMLLHLSRVRGGHAKTGSGSNGNDYLDMIALETGERQKLYEQFVYQFVDDRSKKENRQALEKRLHPRLQ